MQATTGSGSNDAVCVLATAGKVSNEALFVQATAGNVLRESARMLTLAI
jgi:hypothetical protein